MSVDIDSVEVVISIHALRGEDDTQPKLSTFVDTHISIHALRGEDDTTVPIDDVLGNISIHALRGEDDGCASSHGTNLNLHFNPRPPWGGRPRRDNGHTPCHTVFQSTPSVGRTTASLPSKVLMLSLFQSTPSVGRTTHTGKPTAKKTLFQSTPSVGRTTWTD